MFYIVGLGNPGDKYKDTRHNVGWMAMDYFLDQNKLPGLITNKSFSGRVSDGVVCGEEVTVLYPDTFMNNSGSAVAKLVSKKEIEKLIVVHDDIDLPFGEIKIGRGRGAGGNNGVQSIIKKLDSNNFVRIRIGIAPKSIFTGKVKRPAGGGPLERFVLKKFSIVEKMELDNLYKKIQLGIEAVIAEGVESAMNKVN